MDEASDGTDVGLGVKARAGPRGPCARATRASDLPAARPWVECRLPAKGSLSQGGAGHGPSWPGGEAEGGKAGGRAGGWCGAGRGGPRRRRGSGTALGGSGAAVDPDRVLARRPRAPEVWGRDRRFRRRQRTEEEETQIRSTPRSLPAWIFLAESPISQGRKLRPRVAAWPVACPQWGVQHGLDPHSDPEACLPKPLWACFPPPPPHLLHGRLFRHS